MKRYFTLPFSAITRGLKKLQFQSGASEAQENEQRKFAGKDQECSQGLASDAKRDATYNQSEEIHFDSLNNATETDPDELVRGVRYLQNYPANQLQEIVRRVMAEVSSGQVEHLKSTDFGSIDSGKVAQLEAYQKWWLNDLITRMAFDSEASLNADFVSQFPQLLDANCSTEIEPTRKLMILIHATLKSLTAEFNQLVSKKPKLAKLRVSTTEVSEVKETSSLSYLRTRASSGNWSLSLRGAPGKVEIFLVPAAEIFLLSEAESAMRLKTVLRANKNVDDDVWTIDGLTADPDELFYMVRGLFKQLLVATVQDSSEEMLGAGTLQNLEGEELRDAVTQIILTQQNMAQKIVSQQEEIQNRIARDLHDAVIADIMSLKRLLSGDKRLDDVEVVENLDQICTRLREICHDLAPRDLRDWGLQTVIEDLVERLAHRTGADCSFTCNGELPELPYPVQLHIYRIVQESLNNMEKYSQASKIVVRFDIDGKDIKITLRDNGKGFSMSPETELRSKKEGGTGLGGIKERAEMIRCFFKAHLSVVSAPGEGSETILEVKT